MVEEKIYIVYHNYQSLPSEMEFLMTTNRRTIMSRSAAIPGYFMWFGLLFGRITELMFLL